MFISDNWTDYQLLDAEGGERLERWGDYVLIRPDPQVIWHSERVNPFWRKAQGIYRRSSSGGGAWVRRQMPDEWQITYRDLTFAVSPMGFKHTGIFPEQAVNWDYIAGQIQNAGREIRLLNLFAYTGGATCALAAAGAEAVHVDAAKGMVAWAKDNLSASGLADAPVRFIVDDAMKFVLREQRRGRLYDGILMDPPSYGRGPSGEVWKLENELYGLVDLCAQAMSDTPLFFLINGYTTGFSYTVLQNVAQRCLCGRYGGRAEADDLALAVTSGGVLPCGATARWTPRD